MKINIKNFKAFTLSEVLITLSILGVVAAISIPNIVSNFQKRVTITKRQRAYSYIINNIQEALIVNGCETIGCVMQNYGLYNNNNTVAFITKRFKVFFPDIVVDNNNKCTPSSDNIYYLNGKNTDGIDMYAGGHFPYRYCLKNGIGIATSPNSFDRFTNNNQSNSFNCVLSDNNSSSVQCASFVVFLGNPKGKAILGKNAFLFYINPKGELAEYVSWKTCNGTNKNLSEDGAGCIGKILKDGWKMNY